jgi:hypothetical protein
MVERFTFDFKSFCRTMYTYKIYSFLASDKNQEGELHKIQIYKQMV